MTKRWIIIGFPYAVAFANEGSARALANPGQMIVEIHIPDNGEPCELDSDDPEEQISTNPPTSGVARD